ncbi:hypothetical protein Dsin_021495 [Dipteronia sinensis]|uniref:Uncharacterized protein n=1 Tax=Dipteronia sinensis TaxID=43782 RepID=A0AAE0A096_9ROSI|nr:hypothetical protein Dsin_021495 [Dipteronia sinensis]
MQRSRRGIKEDHNNPEKKTTTRMALVDHFRNVEGHENHSMKRRVGLLLPTKLKRVGLKMISGVFGKKKAEDCCFSDSENGGEGNENVGAEPADCKQCTTRSQQQQTSLALKVPASKLQFSSFRNLFGNKKRVGFGFGFLRGKKGGSRDCTSASENGIGGREESSGKLNRVSSRIAIQRLKIGGSMREKSSSINKIEEERVDEELCKKRILMGERCKPLNISGTLHYDQDGILLPDVLP